MVVARAGGGSLLASVMIALAATIGVAGVTTDREAATRRIQELKRLDARQCWGRDLEAGCPVVAPDGSVTSRMRCVDNPLGC